MNNNEIIINRITIYDAHDKLVDSITISPNQDIPKLVLFNLGLIPGQPPKNVLSYIIRRMYMSCLRNLNDGAYILRLETSHRTEDEWAVRTKITRNSVIPYRIRKVGYRFDLLNIIHNTVYHSYTVKENISFELV